MKKIYIFIFLLILSPIIWLSCHSTSNTETANETVVETNEVELRILKPAENESISNPFEVFGYASSPKSIKKIEVFLDNIYSNVAHGTSKWSTSFEELSKLVPGYHTLKVIAYDSNNNSKTKIQSIFVPQNLKITIDSPYNESLVKCNSLISISGEIESVAKPVSVQIRMDDQDWQSVSFQGSVWSSSLSTFGMNPNEVHVLYAKAIDTNSNEVMTSITVNTTDEDLSIKIIEPENNTSISNNVKIKGSALSINGFAKPIEIKIDSGNWISVNGYENWYDIIDLHYLSLGNHIITARVTSSDNYTKECSINLLSSPISIYIKEPKNNQNISPLNLEINGVIDSIYSINEITIYFGGNSSTKLTLNSDKSFSYNGAFLGTTNGINIIKIVAIDSIGNQAQAYINVNLLNSITRFVVADKKNNRIVGFNDLLFNGWKTYSGNLYLPNSVEIDANNQRIFISDTQSNIGRILSISDFFGSNPLSFIHSKPIFGISLDTNNSIYWNGFSNANQSEIFKLSSLSSQNPTSYDYSNQIQNASPTPNSVHIDKNSRIQDIVFWDSVDSSAIYKMSNINGAGLAYYSFGNSGDDIGEIEVDLGGNVYVTTAGNSYGNGPGIIKFDYSLLNLTRFTDPAFRHPEGITLDQNNHIYISDTTANKIFKFDDFNGNGRVECGSPGSGVGQFNQPCSITCWY